LASAQSTSSPSIQIFSVGWEKKTPPGGRLQGTRPAEAGLPYTMMLATAAVVERT